MECVWWRPVYCVCAWVLAKCCLVGCVSPTGFRAALHVARGVRGRVPVQCCWGFACPLVVHYSGPAPRWFRPRALLPPPPPPWTDTHCASLPSTRARVQPCPPTPFHPPPPPHACARVTAGHCVVRLLLVHFLVFPKHWQRHMDGRAAADLCRRRRPQDLLCGACACVCTRARALICSCMCGGRVCPGILGLAGWGCVPPLCPSHLCSPPPQGPLQHPCLPVPYPPPCTAPPSPAPLSFPAPPLPVNCPFLRTAVHQDFDRDGDVDVFHTSGNVMQLVLNLACSPGSEGTDGIEPCTDCAAGRYASAQV
jgi:hypothetical protein